MPREFKASDVPVTLSYQMYARGAAVGRANSHQMKAAMAARKTCTSAILWIALWPVCDPRMASNP